MECQGEINTKWTVASDFMPTVLTPHPPSSEGLRSTRSTINTYMVGVKYSQKYQAKYYFQLQGHLKKDLDMALLFLALFWDSNCS